MRFLPALCAAPLSLALLAACTPAAKAPEAAPPAAEKPVENPAPTPETATPTAALGEPSPEFAALPEPYKSANYAAGRRTFKLCVSCHIAEAGGGHLVGPNLNGIFGRKAGTASGFKYSEALSTADFVWTPEKLDEWLASPGTFLPGNTMSFAGVRKPADRTAVIAYLMTESGYTPPPQ